LGVIWTQDCNEPIEVTANTIGLLPVKKK
jgi:hypothetical protein